MRRGEFLLHNIHPASSMMAMPTGNLACIGLFFADDGFGNFVSVDVLLILNYILSDLEW